MYYEYILTTIVNTLTGPQGWYYFLIPVISGLIGWGTNVVALRMTFHPIEPIGYPPFLGWQGVVPSKALKMAGKTVDIMIPQLITIEEVFDRVDPDKVAEEIEPTFDDIVEPIVEEVMSKHSPNVWQSVPKWIKNKIIPRVRNEVPAMLVKMMDIEGDIEEADPDEVAEQLELAIRTVSEDVLEQHAPNLWESLPKKVKGEVYKRARDDMPHVVSNIFQEWKERINDIFDLREMILTELEKNKQILNEIFLKCGREEFKFIERSGLYFGFLFGIVQMFAWIFFKDWWILPLAGVFVGTATNWMALKLIFQPQEPIEIFGVEIQGLFFKRQNEVSDEYGVLVEEEVLYPENIFRSIFEEQKKEDLFRVMQKHIHVSMDRIGGIANPVIRRIIGPEEYFEMKDEFSERFLLALPDAMEVAYDYLQESLNIGDTLSRKLKALGPSEFEGILRPAFQEDEWILIAVGGVLGGVAGALQLVLLFGGSIPYITSLLTTVPLVS